MKSVVCIGASAGGINAIQRILSGLPQTFSLPIVITIHLPAEADIDFDLVFGNGTRKIMEAGDKTPIESNSVYFAPADYHILVESNGTLALSQEEKVHFARPSIDVFFESAASSLKSRVIGVLLTGANEDGAKGLQCLNEVGALTIVQNPETAEVPYMPSSALRLFRPDFVLDLPQIAAKLIEKDEA